MIEIFADVWCPFAYVGIRKVFQYRDEVGRGDVPIVVRSWPLELVNDAPMAQAKTLGNCDALRRQVASDQFANTELSNFPSTTLDALNLIAQAYEQSVVAGERASLVIREAIFEHGHDVADESVLQRIALSLGVSYVPDAEHQLVRRDWDEGKRRGVVGSPHFFHGADGEFCPALQLTRTEDSGLIIQANAEKLAGFLTTCF
jgi:predicted DsbA family dithiol-disulfide isomerase